MKMKLIEFNRRGAVCVFCRNPEPKEIETLTKEEKVIYKAIAGIDARYFVVMKRINARYMIVVPVFDAKRKDSKIIRINNHQYWVGFMNFYVVPEKIFEAAPGKYLDYSYRTINAIYTSHNNVLKERWRREKEKCMADQELRRRERERKRNERRYHMDAFYPVPGYLQKAARKPYSGGAMASR